MIEQRYDSVWDAIEPSPAQAANMKARVELMLAITGAVEDWKVTQAEAGKRLLLSQPRLNDLTKGRINKFSLDALMNLASRSGLVVRVDVSKAAA